MNKPDRTKARRDYVLRKLALTRARQKAWRDEPMKMEAIRVNATKEASRKKREKNQAIRSVVSAWPETLTSYELRERITADLDYRGKVASLVYRLRRHNLLAYHADGLWHNLCKPA